MFEMQIRFFLSTLDGSFALPSKEKMLEEEETDFQSRLSQGLPRRYAHQMGLRQWRYNDELADLANIDRIASVVQVLYDKIVEMHRTDVTGYRRINFQLIDSETYREIGTDTWND